MICNSASQQNKIISREIDSKRLHEKEENGNEIVIQQTSNVVKGNTKRKQKKKINNLRKKNSWLLVFNTTEQHTNTNTNT